MGDNHNAHPNVRFKPPRFSGAKNEKIKHFLAAFDHFVTFNNIPQADLVAYLQMCLTSVALEFVDNILTREEEEPTFEEVKAQLISRFDDEKLKLVIRSNLHSRRLLVNERIKDLYADIERKAAEIEMSPEDRLFTFLNALPKAMKKHVALRDPQTIFSTIAEVLSKI